MVRGLVRGLVAIGMLCIALAVTGWALSSAKPPRPAVIAGHVETSLHPPHRDAPLTLHIWYPARADGTQGLIGHNALFVGTWKAEGATPAAGPHPLVLFSHGSGGNAQRLGWFAAALAEQGFVVAAPNHAGTTSGDSDPFKTPMVWQRTADMSAVLDRMLSDPPAGLAIDPARITAAGFSLGGHTALALGGARLTKAGFIAYCDKAGDALDCGWLRQAGVDFTAIDAARYESDLSDPRINRVLAIDPALTQAMTATSLATVRHPVAILNLGTTDTLPLGLNAAPTAASLPQASYAALPDAHHFSCLSECSPLGGLVIGLAGEDNICTDSGLRARAAVEAEVIARSLAFLTAR